MSCQCYLLKTNSWFFAPIFLCSSAELFSETLIQTSEQTVQSIQNLRCYLLIHYWVSIQVRQYLTFGVEFTNPHDELLHCWRHSSCLLLTTNNKQSVRCLFSHWLQRKDDWWKNWWINTDCNIIKWLVTSFNCKYLFLLKAICI